MCRSMSTSFGASAGTYGAFSANGNFAFGPKTWKCASHAPGGSLSFGSFGLL